MTLLEIAMLMLMLVRSGEVGRTHFDGSLPPRVLSAAVPPVCWRLH